MYAPLCLGLQVFFVYLNQQQIVLLFVLRGVTLLSNSPVKVQRERRENRGEKKKRENKREGRMREGRKRRKRKCRVREKKDDDRERMENERKERKREESVYGKRKGV